MTRGSFEIALGDQPGVAPEARRLGVKRVGEVGEDVARAEVEDAVDGVEAQPVDVIVGQPVERVVDEEPAHLVAVGPVEVQRGAPRRLVAIGEVRPEILEVVPLRAEVVVDDVEKQRQPVRVAGIHQLAQPDRSSVRLVRSEQRCAVIAPVAIAGEGRHRHQLDGRDAEVAKVGELRRDAGEGSLGRERSDVQLVEDELGEREAAPPVIGPAKVTAADDARRPVHASWLPAGDRIGAGTDAGQEIDVVAADRGHAGRGACAEEAVLGPSHRQLGADVVGAGSEQTDGQCLGAGRPDRERDGAIGGDGGPPVQLPAHASRIMPAWPDHMGGGALPGRQGLTGTS